MANSNLPAKVDQIDEDTIVAELDPHYYSSSDDLYKLNIELEKNEDLRRFNYFK